MVSVSEFAGDEVKIPLHHLPLLPLLRLHRYQLVLSVFLILIDSHVSYIPLTLYINDKKIWGMIDAVR
jgi:hypothetical protein